MIYIEHPDSMPIASIDTPIGRLGLVEADGRIERLLWNCARAEPRTDVLKEAYIQLKSYFNGNLKQFDLPLSPVGDPFQRRVYAAMSAIPYGETRTYGDLARALQTTAQPIGRSCAANPIPVIIPCHRVVAAGGLGGYSAPGGIDTKIALLRLENAIPYLI